WRPRDDLVGELEVEADDVGRRLVPIAGSVSRRRVGAFVGEVVVQTDDEVVGDLAAQKMLGRIQPLQNCGMSTLHRRRRPVGGRAWRRQRQFGEGEREAERQTKSHGPDYVAARAELCVAATWSG